MFGGKIGMTELLVLLGLLLVVLPIIVLAIVAWARIFSKAGYSRWLCITMLIPVANLCVLFWFAFSTWPTEQELARLKNAPPAEVTTPPTEP